MIKCYFCNKEIFCGWCDEQFSACDECCFKFDVCMMQPINKGMQEIHFAFSDIMGIYYESLRSVWSQGR